MQIRGERHAYHSKWLLKYVNINYAVLSGLLGVPLPDKHHNRLAGDRHL